MATANNPSSLTGARLGRTGSAFCSVAAAWGLKFAPDGRAIYFSVAGAYRRDERAPLELGIVSTSGTVIKTFPDVRFATGTGSIQWDRDGKSVIYTTSERMNIFRQPVAGGPPKKITNDSDLVISRFAASPDGQWIALCRGVVARDAFLVSNFR